jgi:hypothetical protein
MVGTSGQWETAYPKQKIFSCGPCGSVSVNLVPMFFHLYCSLSMMTNVANKYNMNGYMRKICMDKVLSRLFIMKQFNTLELLNIIFCFSLKVFPTLLLLSCILFEVLGYGNV